MLYIALGVGAGLVLTAAVLVGLIRGLKSRSWGVCTLTTSLEGKVVVVTGANGGLGLEIVLQCASRGATVVMACRSWENTKEALKLVRDKTGNNDVHYIHLDLSSFHSVREFAEKLTQTYPVIYSLVCNAGVWFPMEDKKKSEEGYEIHAGVNHLGHFLLTNLMLKNIKKAPGSRIVIVSSSLMNRALLDFDNVDHFGEGRVEERTKHSFAPSYAPAGYSDSKMMNALFARELGTRLSESGVKSVAVCPGWCFTKLIRNMYYELFRNICFVPFALMFMRTSSRGAHNIMQAVLEDNDKLVQGGIYRECKIAEAENLKLDGLKEMGVKLWDMSEELVELDHGSVRTEKLVGLEQ